MAKYDIKAKPTYPVGTVLWHMIGRRQDKEIRWYASPLCIEYADNHKFLNADKCGGSWNSIGKNYFLTREECLAHFQAKGNSLLEKISANDPTPDGVTEKPRTDWNDYEITLYGADGNTDMSGASITIYIGFYDRLRNITSRIKWRSEYAIGCGEIKRITLREIYEQARTDEILTVFYVSALRTDVYQCGNYKQGQWVKVGKLFGYA